MSSRRRAVRRPRRVQVQFWRQGDPTSHVGYTTNISMTGMFIATNSPIVSGARIRVEVIDRERGFMVEGVVAHARKIQLELTRVHQSGMGVRFLTVEDLVRELIPAGYGESEEIPREMTRTAPMAPPPAEPPPLIPPPDIPPLPELGAPEPVAAPPSPPARPPVSVAPSGGVFAVRFSGVEEFMEVYRRDILQGGLFVSTLYPARLQETVHVEMFPPLLHAEPLLVRARVVQRFEPHADSGRNLLSGMGLELTDLPELLKRLEPVMERLRG